MRALYHTTVQSSFSTANNNTLTDLPRMKSRVLTVSVCSLLLSTVAPNTQAQLSIKAGNVKVEANATTGDAAKSSSTSSDELGSRVKTMQASIQKATDKLKNAGKSSAEQTKALDAVAQEVQSALKEVSPAGGGMYDELQKRIKESESNIKMWQDKSLDPKISGQMQQKYNDLAQRLSRSKDELYKNQISLDNQRNALQKKLQEVNENKEFVAALLQANDLEDANKAIQDVVLSMNSVSKSFDDLLNKITSGGISEKTQ